MKELVKEDLENLSYKDITNIILEREKRGFNTLELFTKIVKILELPNSVIDTKIGDYYTSLAIDKRFVLVDGIWDLRSRHTSDKVILKIEDDEEEETEINNIQDDDIMSEDEAENEDNYESDNNEDEELDSDEDEDLSDLVVLDEDELELDQ